MGSFLPNRSASVWQINLSQYIYTASTYFQSYLPGFTA